MLAAAPAAVGAQQPGGLVVRKLTFEGNRAIDEATLAAAISTTSSSWLATSGLVKWIGLGQRRYFNEIEFQRDVLRLALFYRQSGYLDVKVDTLVRRTLQDVYITFRITEGLPVVIDSLRISGLDSLVPKQQKTVLTDLPLRPGDPFNRYRFQALADTVTGRLRNLGYPDAETFRSFEMDRVHRRASLGLEAVPGPAAWVGPIRVEGTERTDSGFVARLLATRPGRRYAQDDLFRSQRNLYRSELFRFASVEIDTAHRARGDTLTPLLVRVNESSRYRGRGQLGYGTNDCFRVGLGFTYRGFLGAGRLFDVSARASKIGVGEPTDLGFVNNICRQLADDSVGSSRLNYAVQAAIRRPAFLGSANILAFTLFSERRSEFRVYQREEAGGAVSLQRETARRVPLALTYRLSYGRTQATDANFCAVFNACTLDDIALLSQRRWLATLSATATWPRANNPLDPTRGWVASVEATASSRVLGSSRFQTFTRGVVDIAWYRPLGTSGAVLSWRLRGGIIFSPEERVGTQAVNFIPPDQRFYAGGPNDVRGYQRNELGPVVYVVSNDSFPADSARQGFIPPGDVRYSATGGNTLGTANIELRVPAPFWGERLRFAFFADAGTLFERGGPPGRRAALIRVTPGAGIRFATPLGPIRLDAGYNPYDRPRGALYLQRRGELILVTDSYVQQRSSKWTLHFSVGQAF